MVFNHRPQNAPDLDLARKTPVRPDGDHPSQCPHRKSTKPVQRNPCDTPLGAGWNREFPDIGPGFGEPPSQEVLFMEPFLRNLVIDDGRGFVAQPLSCCQQSTTKLGVLASDLSAGSGPKSVRNPPYLSNISLRKAMFVPNGGSASSQASGPQSNMTNGANA